MLRQLLPPYRFTRLATLLGSSAILALGLCGCQTAGPSDITGSLGDKAESSRAADPRHDVEVYHDRFRANPKDADAALQYGKALRATGQRPQAVAVLRKADEAPPRQKGPLSGFRGALGEHGKFHLAFHRR